MASLHFSPLLITISITIFISLLSSPVSSITCENQKLPPQRSFHHCTNLPTFNATLHYTYILNQHSLSIAFAIDAPKSDGWVAWGINPSGPKMFGSGAFIAVKENGTLKVDEYSLISAQVPYKKEKLPYDVKALSVEEVNGVITIFAVLVVPEKAENLSQIWQVGPVVGGVIKGHAAEKVNDDSKSPLTFEKDADKADSPNTHDDKKTSGGVVVMMRKSGFRFYFGLALVLLGLMSM
ncbi:hypothetical protein TanjilG_28998 [Lupinus angustifolius]|uniref:DOMON domain-containing protein n=1 Tax=Lupinus angustifolius TaxID=3871 RepID=A0A4P1RTF8_LUPAN|nr:PREDICTED: auxin-induced in root cultures protein 12 [Lupinus angustifolius]OIW17648.1 hypothetical protein TanjilG_28998 [Lupinus angustifolius]